ncbi:MAG: hypothetical protein AAGD11_06325 [Planctomycetota bacterium]
MDQSQWKVTLLNENAYDGRALLARMQSLKRMFKNEPEVLKLIFSHAIDTRVAIPDEIQKENTFIFHDGLMVPEARDFFLNAVTIIDGKLKLQNPFKDTEQNRLVLETIRENVPIHAERIEVEFGSKRNDGRSR